MSRLTVYGGGTSPLTTKGDLYGYSTAGTRVPVGADGQLMVADSAQATGLRWAAGARNLPWIGSTYFTTVDHGIGTQTSGTVALVANTLYLHPFWLPYGLTTLTACYVNVTTSGAGNGQFGLFALDTGGTATLVATLGTISVSATGVIGSTGLAQPIPQGVVYLLGFVTNIACTVTRVNSGSGGVGFGSAGWWNSTDVGLTVAMTYGPFAATYTGLAAANTGPGFGLKGS